MNLSPPNFQAGQTHFGGYQLIRQTGADAAGLGTWLAKRNGATFLLQVLPIQRALAESEMAPLIKLKIHGQSPGQVARQMTLWDVCAEDGQPPLTALVESFPPLTDGAAEWLPLTEWVKRHGPATAAQITPHLPALSSWLSGLPTGRHGSLCPEQIWITESEGCIASVTVAAAGLADWQKQVPEMRLAAAAWPDASGLGQVLYLWLTGKMPPPANHRDVLADLRKAHTGAQRTPDHWQRVIASNVDADPAYHSANVTEMVAALVNPVHSTGAAASPISQPNPPQDHLSKAVAVLVVVLLSFGLLHWLNHKHISETTVQELPQKELPPPPKAPELKPQIIPPTEAEKVTPVKVPQVVAEPREAPPVPPAPAPPKKGIVTQSSPLPKSVKPATEQPKTKVAQSLPERPKVVVTAPKIRIPYRPPSPPSRIASQAFAPPPIRQAKKGTPRVEKQQPEVETAAPKALPIARAQVVPNPAADAPGPRVILALPIAEPLVQAVSVPEEQPAPSVILLDKPSAILPPQTQERRLLLPPGPASQGIPDKPLWVRPQ